MASVTVDYIPKPKQALFHQSDAQECLFGGAKSPGKSCALTMEAVAYALEYPGTTPYLFRSSFDDLEANLIEEFIKRVPKELYNYDGQKHNAHLNNGSTIKFRYISNEVDAYKYNGRSIPWIGVDELTEHMEKEIQILLSCNRSASRVPVRFRATANPGNKGHKYVYKRYIQPTDYGKKTYIDPVTSNKVQFIPATVYDGVLVENDPAYVKRLENLPETERRAYLLGDWDIFEGQFFSGSFGIHNLCHPFIIDDQEDNSRIFGSLDHGLVHPTSFGLWYLSPNGTMYRIFTYHANGGTTRRHAEAICEAIESCRFTRYIYPCEVFYDYSMNEKVKMNEYNYRSVLDEYEDVFRGTTGGKNTVFIPANKRKVDGCHMMRQAFDLGNGEPILQYYAGLNEPFKEGIENALTDKLNPEIYAKMDGDDCADEARYGIMGIISKMSAMKVAKKKSEPFVVNASRPLEITRSFGGLS